MDITDKRKRKFFGERFTEFLEKWEKENNATQKAFCDVAGVSKNIVTAWKSGKRFPRDTQMQKICETFGVDQRAFEPFFPLEKHFVYNTNTKYWSDTLQKYAEEKGLDEKWYEYFISRPYFLRRFPFERKAVSNSVDKEFDLVKFQFEDEAGNRVMMTKTDIDFLVRVQNKSAEMIDYQMYRQKQRNERNEIESKIDIWIRHYYGEITREEVLSKLYPVDLTKMDEKRTDADIFNVIFQIAKEKGIKPRYSKAEIIDQYITNDPLITEEWKQAWREWGKINGQEQKAEEIIRKQEERQRKIAQELIEDYRSKGILIEDTEE